MAGLNLFDTNTVALQDLLGNGKTFSVPPYQRDYSWDQDQWEDLWLDMVEIAGTDSKHYMGAIVVLAESDVNSTIIDGQQRIATLSIFALAVINLLENLDGNEKQDNEERANVLRRRFIGEKDAGSLNIVGKLVLNENDNGFYQDYLVQLKTPPNPKKLSRSNRKLWDCFNYFYSRLNREFTSQNGREIAEFLSLHVSRKLMFIQIKVDSELSAFTVFETLNARGLELTSSDLLKNYLFSKMNAPSDLESVQRRWKRLIDKIKQEKFGDFLRYHYMATQGPLRSTKLFKALRDNIKHPSDVFSLLDSLEGIADLYAALREPNDILWDDFQGAKEYVRVLDMFKVSQATPLIFAAYLRLPPPDFVRILKVITIITFRFTTIGRRNTNELETTYQRVALQTVNQELTTPREIFDALNTIYVGDKEFENDFQNYRANSSRKKIIKYILAKIESRISGRSISDDTDQGTIEHILPENPVEGWEHSIPEKSWEEYAYRLGNLTLLPASVNKTIGNALYSQKLLAYKESDYSITKVISTFYPIEWTVSLIQQRQEFLAKEAVQIWRSDFAEPLIEPNESQLGFKLD